MFVDGGRWKVDGGRWIQRPPPRCSARGTVCVRAQCQRQGVAAAPKGADRTMTHGGCGCGSGCDCGMAAPMVAARWRRWRSVHRVSLPLPLSLPPLPTLLLGGLDDVVKSPHQGPCVYSVHTVQCCRLAASKATDGPWAARHESQARTQPCRVVGMAGGLMRAPVSRQQRTPRPAAVLSTQGRRGARHAARHGGAGRSQPVSLLSRYASDGRGHSRTHARTLALCQEARGRGGRGEGGRRLSVRLAGAAADSTCGELADRPRAAPSPGGGPRWARMARLPSVLLFLPFPPPAPPRTGARAGPLSIDGRVVAPRSRRHDWRWARSRVGRQVACC